MEVVAEIGSSILGAYDLTVTFDDRAVEVRSILGGATAEFSGPPVTDPASFSSGAVRLVAFNATSLTSPSGTVSIARVRFTPTAGSHRTRIEVFPRTLADTNGHGIPMTGGGCDLQWAASESPSPTHRPQPTATPAATCSGDCDRDGKTTVDELLIGIQQALGEHVARECAAFDRDHSGQVTIDEILAAVGAALSGCSPSTPTIVVPPSPSATTTASVTPPPSTSPTRTPANVAPIFGTGRIYRGVAGEEISWPLGCQGPGGAQAWLSASELPPGASAEAMSGTIHWVPQSTDTGVYRFRAFCRFGTASIDDQFAITVAPAHACRDAACTEASGCSFNARPLTEECCTETTAREVLPGVLTSCPNGAEVRIGRNVEGFGRLTDCDSLRVINFQQAGAAVRINVWARCLEFDRPITMRATLRTRERQLFDHTQRLTFRRNTDGSAERHALLIPVEAEGPFFDFDSADALFTVTLTDANGTEQSTDVRLILTFDEPPDLPDQPDIDIPSP